MGQVRCPCKATLGSAVIKNGVIIYHFTNVRLVRLAPYASGLRSYRYLIDSSYERPAQLLCESSFHVPVFANVSDTHGEYHDLKITVSKGLTMYTTSQHVQFGFRDSTPLLKNVPNPCHTRKNKTYRSSKNGNILKISKLSVGACRKDLRKLLDQYSREKEQESEEEQESEAEASNYYQEAPIQLPKVCATPEIDRISQLMQENFEVVNIEGSSDDDTIDIDEIINANVSFERLTNSADHQPINNMSVSPMMPQFEPDAFDLDPTFDPFTYDDFSSIDDLNGIFGLP